MHIDRDAIERADAAERLSDPLKGQDRRLAQQGPRAYTGSIRTKYLPGGSPAIVYEPLAAGLLAKPVVLLPEK